MTNEHDQRIRSRRVQAGGLLRDLAHRFVGTELSEEQLARLCIALDAAIADIEPGPPRSRVVADLPISDRPVPQGPLEPDLSDRPVSGASSPLGFDVDVAREGDDIVAELTLRSAHEGAPGRAHGGIVAALFDDVMGFVLGVIAQPAFTGELTTRYVGQTPLDQRLRCRARCTGREGRKIYMTAELHVAASDVTCATATATFITVDRYPTNPQVEDGSADTTPAPPTHHHTAIADPAPR